MGTTSPLSVFLVFFLLLFSCSHLIPHCNCRKLVSSSVTPKTAAIQYWNLKMGNNKPPPIFLSKLSTLSPVELINENYNNMRAMMSDEVKEKASTFAILYHHLDVTHNQAITSAEVKEKTSTFAILYHSPDNTHTHNHNQENTSDDVKEKASTFAILYHSPDDNNPRHIMTSDEVKEKAATFAILYHIRDDNNNHSRALMSDEIKEKASTFAILYHNPDDNNPSRVMTSDEVKEKASTFAIFYHNRDDNNNHSRAMTSDEIKEKASTFAILYQNPEDNNQVMINDETKEKASALSILYHNSEDNNNNPYQVMTSDEVKEKAATFAILYHSPEDNNNNRNHVMTSDEVKEKASTFPIVYHNHDDNLNHNQVMTSNELKEKAATFAILYHSPDDKNNNKNQAMKSDEVKEKAATFAILYHSLHHNRASSASSANNNNNNNNIHMVTSTTSDGDAFKAKKEIVLPGTWFRESQLKKGTMMPLLDFRGMMPQQHFLPRNVASTIPFSATEIKKIFHISEHETKMAKAVDRTITLCKMPPNPDEIKTCITSAEDLIDFLHSSLGSNKEILVSTTENENGCGSEVLFGDVKVVNYNGEVASKIVTCHQAMFPYMLQHCHTIPDTRVYEVEILDAETKKKINQATALCHMDTSTWGATYSAFQVLGSTPGKIEACHWISPWGTIWTTVAA